MEDRRKCLGKVHLTSTKDGSFINIPKQDNTCVKVQIVNSHPYLGVTLHHTKLEQHTMQVSYQTKRHQFIPFAEMAWKG